jgi:hypothetical protein
VLRVALAVGLLVIGLAVGLASVAVHSTWWGLPLALVTTALTAYAAPSGWPGRLPFVLGWAVAVGVLAVPRGEGDFVIAGDVSGYALLGFGVMVVVAGFATLPAPRNNAPSGAGSS